MATMAKRIVDEITISRDSHSNRQHVVVNIHSDIIQSALAKHPDVTDVLVVAIMGPSRKGKSFLMNLIALFLQKFPSFENQSDRSWLQGNDKIKGLNWKQSRSVGTEGIWLWDQVFLINGVKILLLDCQGSFDKDRVDQSQNIDAIINGIGIKTSTIQLLNVPGMHDANHEQALVNSLLYFPREGSHNNLYIINRDWQADDDFSLQKNIQDFKENTAITEQFGDISAFRLPYPGETVIHSSSSDDILLSDIYSDLEGRAFLEGVSELCKHLFTNIDKKTVTSSQKIIDNFNRVGDKFGRNFIPLHFASSAERLKFDIAETKLSGLRDEYREKIDKLDTKSFKSKDELSVKLDNLIEEATSKMEVLRVETNIGEHEAGLIEDFQQHTVSIESALRSAKQTKVALFEEAALEDGNWLELAYEFATDVQSKWLQCTLKDRVWRFVWRQLQKIPFIKQLCVICVSAKLLLSQFMVGFLCVALLMMTYSYGLLFSLIFVLCFAGCMYQAFEQGRLYQSNHTTSTPRDT